jgi:hypothetical protein
MQSKQAACVYTAITAPLQALQQARVTNKHLATTHAAALCSVEQQPRARSLKSNSAAQ